MREKNRARFFIMTIKRTARFERQATVVPERCVDSSTLWADDLPIRFASRHNVLNLGA
jgi:hypothetical protein